MAKKCSLWIALTECINVLSYLVMFKENIHQLHQHINNDQALQQLKQTIQERLARGEILSFST